MVTCRGPRARLTLLCGAALLTTGAQLALPASAGATVPPPAHQHQHPAAAPSPTPSATPTATGHDHGGSGHGSTGQDTPGLDDPRPDVHQHAPAGPVADDPPRGLVLGGFAAVNAGVLATAAVLRHRETTRRTRRTGRTGRQP